MSSAVEGAVENDFAKPEKQQARAFLRERFLRVISSLKGELNFNTFAAAHSE